MKNIDARLDALERQMAHVIAHAPCPECGGPSPEGVAVYVLEQYEELGACSACGKAVGCDGGPLGALSGGKLRLTVIRLDSCGEVDGPDPPVEDREEEDPPEPPSQE